MKMIHIPQWAYPSACILVLLFLYPTVRSFDRSLKVRNKVAEMQTDVQVDTKAGGRAEDVETMESLMNELLDGTGGQVQLSRTGTIIYTSNEDGEEYRSQFFIESIDYYVYDNSVHGECKSVGCVSITKVNDVLDDEIIESDEVYLITRNAELGDRLIRYLDQFKALCATDEKIETGPKRKLRKWFDRII